MRLQITKPHYTNNNRLPNFPPVLYPDYKICLILNNFVLTSAYSSQIHRSLHVSALSAHIQKKNKWIPNIFNSIDWNAHEQAFKWKSRQRTCHLAKIRHGLVNTNKQNNLYHGLSPLCLVCHTKVETFQHILTCRDTRAIARSVAQGSRPVPTKNRLTTCYC